MRPAGSQVALRRRLPWLEARSATTFTPNNLGANVESGTAFLQKQILRYSTRDGQLIHTNNNALRWMPLQPPSDGVCIHSRRTAIHTRTQATIKIHSTVSNLPAGETIEHVEGGTPALGLSDPLSLSVHPIGEAGRGLTPKDVCLLYTSPSPRDRG